MSAEEIRAEAEAAYALPEGHAKAQRFETLASRAREVGDPQLEAQVLLALSHAHAYGAEQDKLPVVFGRLLQLLDQFPDAVGSLSHQIYWQLKWMTSGLLGNPDVPLAVGYHWLDELDLRYRQRGYSLRPVHAQRALLALGIGDFPTASAQVEASIAAARDQMSDCQACEQNDWGRWRAALGDDEGALSRWRPVLDGTVACLEEPHQVLGHALLPLLRTGRLDEARGAFLRGYSLARQNINLMVTVGQHIEFCALTGNEARGLEILAEHQGWLADRQVTARKRLDFTGGVTVLLRRLTELGHGSLPVGAAGVSGTQTVASLAAALEEESRGICARYDARNGNSAVSDQVAARLGQEPLVAQLPLGLPTRLPAAPVVAAAPAAAPRAGLDELIARARTLAELRHPETGKVWARIAAISAAAGQDLPADVAAQVARASAGKLVRTDPAAAHTALLEVAGRFAELEAMPKVDVPYNQTGIAQTRELYGRSLRAVERHRDAAEQFLEAARIIADDPAT